MSNCPGAIKFDSAGSAFGYTNYNLDYAHTVAVGGDNRILVVGVSVDYPSDIVTSVKYANTPLTQAKSYHNANGYFYLYFLKEPPTGSNAVHVDYTTGYQKTTIISASYTGVAQTTPINVLSGAQDANIFTQALPTTADSSWVFDFISNPYTLSAGAGTARRKADDYGTVGAFDSNGPIRPAASYSLSATQGSGGNVNYSYILAELSPSTAPLSYSSSWCQPIVIQKSKVPAGLSNYVLTVNDTDAHLKAAANGGYVQNASGNDIVFASDSQAQHLLSWDPLEVYDSTTGKVATHVWVGDVSATNDTTIYRCAGDSAATTFRGASTGAVWPQANAPGHLYTAVYHLGDGTTLSTGDASDNAQNATVAGASAATGLIGGGATLTNAGDVINLPASSGIRYSGSDTFSFTALLKLSSLKGTTQVLYDDRGEYSETAFYVSGQGYLSYYYGQACASSITSLVADQWYHVAVTQSGQGGACKIYLNGQLMASGTGDGSSSGAMLGAAVGNFSSSPSQVVGGVLDEVRFTNTVLSSDRITAEYNNQTDPSTFYIPGTWTTTTGRQSPPIVAQPPATGGTSLVLTPGVTVSITNPNLPQTQSWRVEFQLHGWAPPTADAQDGNVWDLNGIGANSAISQSGLMRFFDKRDFTGGGSPCALDLNGRSNVLVRVQRDVSKMVFVCELWNYDGSHHQQSSVPILSFRDWPYGDGGLGSGDTTAQLGFLRIYDSAVPLGGQPPVTAAATAGNLLDMEFDGTLTDSSPNHYSTTSAGGYANTPNLGVFAFIKTADAPSWSDWVSLRAGYGATLDGSRSYSMSSQSSAVSYQWSVTPAPGAPMPILSGATTATPVVNGLVFGTYQFTLSVSDAAGNHNSTSLTVGVVATDDHHVVIYPDDRLYAILGPQIAFGSNPWGVVDYKQYQLEEYWGNRFAIHGGTWDYEPDMTSVNGIPRLGTAYIAASSNTVDGVGTNFADVFCGGNTANGAPVSTYSYINIRVPHAGTAPLSYYRYIDHCNGQNQIVMVAGYFWESQPAVPFPGYSWGTVGFCSDCGNWSSANNTTSNLNYYDGQGLGNYAFYYRSGWNKPQQTAQFVADHWYRNNFVQSPRDWELTSAEIRATIDTLPAPQYDAWPTLRNLMSGISCTNVDSTSGQIADARENGSCLMYRATQALLDPDPASKGIAQTYLANAFSGTWDGQQKAEGNWVQNVPGGNTAYTIQLSNGSARGTLAHGSEFPPTLCGEDRARVLNTGILSVYPDRLTVTGTGVNFLTAGVTAGDILVGTGTFAGNIRSFVTAVASVTSTSSLTIANQWRGDIGTLSFYRIYKTGTGLIGGSGNATQYFVNADSQGNLTFPFTQDTDNFYVCSVTNGTTLTLDKPYTGQTAVNPYRLLQTTDLDGAGTQPFMMAFPELGSAIASAALAGSNPSVSAGYNRVLSAGVGWLWDRAYDSVNGGMWYGYGFSNCTNLQGQFWPVYGCSGGTLAQSQSYSVETGVAFARQYLLSGQATDKTRGDTLYNSAYAAPGFDRPPGLNESPNYADLLDCCDTFTQTKYYGQVFALGQAASWPAARLGGLQPAIPQTASISFSLSAVKGAASVRVDVTAPSGSTTASSFLTPTVTCSSSPCQITIDKRQGTHWYKITYLDGSGRTLNSTDPVLLSPI